MPPKEPRPRGTQRYGKPALSHEALLEHMLERGLDVDDRDRTLRYLRHVGYFRFSPYLIPFRDQPQGETLRPGTTFDAVLDLYVFDRHLRLLVLDALERVEVAVRASLTDHMSVTHKDPFWYTNTAHFQDVGEHRVFLDMVRKTSNERLLGQPEQTDGALSHTSALEHYLVTYGSPELPPAWLMVETLTIGQLYRLLRNVKSREDRSAVAKSLGLNEPLLLSWLKSYVRVRNICAHHGRLWNAGLGVYPAIPKTSSVHWLAKPSVITSSPDKRKRLYPVLVSLASVLSVVSPATSWAQRLSDLLDKHPSVPLHGMGIHEDWRADQFWAQKIAR